jgi:hypothetical protein
MLRNLHETKERRYSWLIDYLTCGFECGATGQASSR